MTKPLSTPRTVLFITGTRAELGLMLPTLAAIRKRPGLRLRVVATGMHLDPRFGPRLAALKAAGVRPDAVVPWRRSDNPSELAEVTGNATARLARVYRELGADLVLLVGDRVEAFAAASAAHVARIPVAHVHGGDRAEGQVDDALRHAITQLSHLHLAASPDAVARLIRLGQDRRSVHLVGAPGVEHIRDQAAGVRAVRARFANIATSALVLLHPADPDPETELSRARQLLRALRVPAVSDLILLTPNNDPGSAGILTAWHSATADGSPRAHVLKDLPRPLFLGLLRDAAVLVGNSSAGVIEAGSFGTPVINIGPRQAGRLAGPNVTTVPYGLASVRTALARALGLSRTPATANPYFRPGTSARIAGLIATTGVFYPAPPKRLTY